MNVLLLSMASHLVATQLLPPWWVPDLTLIGLVVVIIRTPRRWLTYSALAGLFTMCWVARDPVPIGLAYGVVGWVTQLLMQEWDLGDPRLACGVVAAACAAMTLGLLWLEDLWSAVMIGWFMIRVTVTIGSALLAHRVLRHLLGPPAPTKSPGHGRGIL